MAWYNDYSYSYTSSADLKDKTEKYVKKMAQKGEILTPVILTGRIIARNWWGKSWCENLESYADYSNRLDRGKKYIRAGAVADLKIDSGKIDSLVMGSSSKPYNVKVRIDELSEEQIDSITSNASSKIQNLESLVNGDFPDDLKELFLKRNGLFPKMSNIHFSCNCPDIADMCKHVASVLYAIGAKFDSEPMMFFKLRGIDTQKLIGDAIKNRLEKMLSNSDVQSERIISDEKLTAVFGI